MGQEDVFKLLKKKPRLTTRELAEQLDRSIYTISRTLTKMLRNRDIVHDIPTEKERKRLLKKYPNYATVIDKIKIFEVLEENPEDEEDEEENQNVW